MKLNDCTVLITGGSQGIGRALAIHFGAVCQHVIVTARNESGLLHTAEDVRGAGGSCEYIVADLSSREDIEGLTQTLSERGDHVDLVIHNAADVTSKPLVSTTDEEIEALVLTNVAGPLQLTRRLIPMFRDEGPKTIVFISSLAGYKPNPSQTVYSITKSAVNASATALRAELAPQGFTVINAPLSSVEVSDNAESGATTARTFARRLESAIVRGRRELFLSPLSRAVMRLYGIFPGLMRF